MNVLLVAPQPFYQERGTPIAVDLLARALSDQGHDIDLLVFNEGEDRSYPNMTIHRVQSWPNLHNIKPGFSLKKLYLDLWLFFKLIKLLRQKQYDVVHAIEESAFFSILLRPFFKYKTVFDIDSSMTTQLLDKFSALRILQKPLRLIESIPMRKSDVVVPMCQALADEVKKYRSEHIYLLKDIDLGQSEESRNFHTTTNEDIRDLFINSNPSYPLFMYIGNLESYQGIDLMIQSFAKVIDKGNRANLVIIGGSDNDQQHYKQLIKKLNKTNNIILAGKRPIAGLSYFMKQADYLVSPRTKGVNTPMKIYSYLASGKPVLATALATHLQVMNDDVAALAAPTVDDFSATMMHMINSPEQFKNKAFAAGQLIEKEHSYTAFYSALNEIYTVLESL